MPSNPPVVLLKDSDNEIVVRVTSRFTTTQITSATSCTLALTDQAGVSAGVALTGSYDAAAKLSEADDVLGGWVFAVTPAYVDSEGIYQATFTIVASAKTRVARFACAVTDRV
jgi:hypothetical protein